MSCLDDKKCIICFTLFNPYTNRHVTCSKECRVKRNFLYQNSKLDNTQSKDYGRNITALWRERNKAKAVISNVNSRDKNHELDIEWAQKRIDAGVCEFTGISFVYPKRGVGQQGFNHNPWGVSVDRIDPEKGYVKDNCRLVVWAFNRAKGKWCDDTMILLAKGILNQQEE